MNCGSSVTSLIIKSGLVPGEFFTGKQPRKHRHSPDARGFSSPTSETESPTMTQSHIWTSIARTAFMSASGEGLGLCVSNAVTTCAKYFAKPCCSSSFIMSCFRHEAHGNYREFRLLRERLKRFRRMRYGFGGGAGDTVEGLKVNVEELLRVGFRRCRLGVVSALCA